MRRFVETCDAVAATTKKTEKVRLVSEYVKTLSIDDAARAAVFLTGRPYRQGILRLDGCGDSRVHRLFLAAHH
jgi:hypothetical protein